PRTSWGRRRTSSDKRQLRTSLPSPRLQRTPAGVMPPGPVTLGGFPPARSRIDPSAVKLSLHMAKLLSQNGLQPDGLLWTPCLSSTGPAAGEHERGLKKTCILLSAVWT